MTPGVLDTIVLTFVTALQRGFGILQQFSVPLLGAFAVLALLSTLLPVLATGALWGNAVAVVLLNLVKIGGMYFFLLHFYPWAIGALEVFLTWGMAPSGGVLTVQDFLRPSTILETGLRVAFPLIQFAANLGVVGTIVQSPFLVLYGLLYLVVVACFCWMAFSVIFTLIEYHLAVMTGAVLVPFGILTQTAMFAEFALGWICGGLIRSLLTATLLGIAVPLFRDVRIVTAPGSDPTLLSAAVATGVSLLFAYMVFTIPQKAALVGGRGMALGLGSGLHAVTGWRAVGTAGAMLGTVGSGVVRGASALLRR